MFNYVILKLSTDEEGNMKLIKAEKQDLQIIYSQMEQNFIREEIRDYEDAKTVFDNEKYTVLHIIEADEKVGFMCIWNLDGFTFLEHFVVYGQYRGKGYGGVALDMLLKQSDILVLECEPPETLVQKKRVDFYACHGMRVNDREYFQPPYRKGGEGCNLKLFSSKELPDFDGIVKTIYKEVYGVNYEQ